MDEGQRLRRKDPVRCEPIRSFSSIYQRSAPHGAPEPSATKPGNVRQPDGSWSDVVAEAVTLGYRVIEEEIEQGRRVAEQLGKRSYGLGAASNDIGETADRFFQYSADLWSLWLDFLSSLAGSTVQVRGVSHPSTSVPPSNGASMTGVSVEVISSQPTQATLRLYPGVKSHCLVARALTAQPAGAPPLSDVRLVRDTERSVKVLLRIPEGQPPGHYAGVVVDGDTDEALGTLTVRLGNQP